MDWIGNVFLLVSIWLVGDKKRYSFIIATMGAVCWAIWAWNHGRVISLIFIELAFIVMYVRGWLKWKDSKEKTNA